MMDRKDYEKREKKRIKKREKYYRKCLEPWKDELCIDIEKQCKSFAAEHWGLDTAIAAYLYPRMKYFREHHVGTPVYEETGYDYGKKGEDFYNQRLDKVVNALHDILDSYNWEKMQPNETSKDFKDRIN